jgi:alpha-ribazole phosphatase
LGALSAFRGGNAAPGTLAVVTHAGALRGALAVATGLRLVDLWRLRIDYATRVTLHYGRAGDGRLWGEILEIVQP